MNRSLVRALSFLCCVATTSAYATENMLDAPLNALIATYNSDRVAYQNGTLTLYTKHLAADSGYTKILAMLSVGIGIAGGCAYYGTQHNDMMLAWAGIPLAVLGACATKKFIETLRRGDTKVAYLTLDSQGLLLHDVRCFAWKDVAYEIASVNASGEKDITVRKIVFTDAAHNNLFELYESSFFLPISFDDFVQAVECYQAVYGKREEAPAAPVATEASEQTSEVVSNARDSSECVTQEQSEESGLLSEQQHSASEQTEEQTPEQSSDAQLSTDQTPPEYVSTPLIDACKEGNSPEVKRLLKLDVDVNQTDSYGNTALIMATVYGYAGLVKLLLAAHANPDLQNSSGETALIEAVWNDNPTIVNTLLESRADVNFKNHYGITALMRASIWGYIKFVNLLIAAGANVDAQDKWGRTALYYAMVNGFAEIVKSLLNAGANPNMQDTDGDSILKKAAGFGNLEIVKLLLAANVDVSLKDKLGVTAARCAATDEIAELIQRHAVQASPDSRQCKTESQQDQQQKDTKLPPLLDACWRGDVVKVQKLLADGADVNQVDANQTTALIVASYCGHTEIVKLLLALHADPNHQNINGLTALAWVAACGYRDITKLLIDAHADVNIKDKDGETALMLAATFGYTAIVKQLLEAGAFALPYLCLPDQVKLRPANKEIEQLIYDHIYKNDGYLPWYVNPSCVDIENEPGVTLEKLLHHVGKFLSNYAKKVTK